MLIDYEDYSNTIFRKSLGFDGRLSGQMSGYLNTWFFLASFIPWLLIDRIGRRPLVSTTDVQQTSVALTV